jgi:hypothetical protein
MKFAIRDDDISYFTSPKQLKKTYSKIWETAPVSFAVTPFMHGSVCIVPKKYRADKTYPIGKNAPLVRLLKDAVRKGKATIMLHGYSHKKDGYGEFDTNEDMSEKVREGKEYLENIFDTRITCFVAPNNAFSKAGMTAVIKNKLDIIGSPPITHRPIFFSWDHIRNAAAITLFRIFHSSGIKYPYTMKFKTHREIYCYSIVPSTKMEELKTGIEFSRKKQGLFCVTVHSNTIDKHGLSLLKWLVTESRKLGAEFLTADKLL